MIRKLLIWNSYTLTTDHTFLNILKETYNIAQAEKSEVEITGQTLTPCHRDLGETIRNM